ncbi:MAG TPA: shikimate kinase [Pyrinomonadaceae bacterium]|jgi:shikimate kinase|nr:shikimate kinase [Pyrinomonadaceae bacterium]
MNKGKRLVLTGFMGVGKSSVGRHLAQILHAERIDLDFFIEKNEKRKISDIIDVDGEAAYRTIESANLRKLLDEHEAQVISLGGGTWIVEANRELIKKKGLTSIWLESTFEHCWYNIKFSHKERPLARDKEKAKKLFEDRKKIYCLADWHFIIKPEYSSYDIAKLIHDEYFS